MHSAPLFRRLGLTEGSCSILPDTSPPSPRSSANVITVAQRICPVSRSSKVQNTAAQDLWTLDARPSRKANRFSHRTDSRRRQSLVTVAAEEMKGRRFDLGRKRDNDESSIGAPKSETDASSRKRKVRRRSVTGELNLK